MPRDLPDRWRDEDGPTCEMVEACREFFVNVTRPGIEGATTTGYLTLDEARAFARDAEATGGQAAIRRRKPWWAEAEDNEAWSA